MDGEGRSPTLLGIEPDACRERQVVAELDLEQVQGVDTPRIQQPELEVLGGEKCNLSEGQCAMRYRNCVVWSGCLAQD